MKARILGLDENLKSTLSPFQELLSLAVEDEAYAKLEPKQKREKTFEAFRDLIVRGSQERPLILAIEDLHWIDKTSEEFLDYMIGWLPSTRILLILLYRPEYTHNWGGKSYYCRIGVDQLSGKTSEELVRAILDGGDVTPDLRDLILNRASGNPFFVEELTQNLLETGAILKQADQYVLQTKAWDIQVPDTIQGIIAARMDRLEENLKQIMQVAAVIGREFAFSILHAITDMKEDLKSNLINLQGLEFIYEKNLFPELEYIFRHALSQEVAYNSLLLKRRKEIHEKIGKAIEDLYPDRLEEFYEMLACHYSRSENNEKAVRYFRLSGEKAEKHYSHLEAYGFFKRAIELLNRLPATEKPRKAKLEILRLIRIPAAPLSYPEGTLEMFEEGEKAQDVELMVPLAASLCLSYQGTGRYADLNNMVPRVIELLEKKGRQFDSFSMTATPYALLCGYRGMILGYLGKFEEGESVLEKGLSNAATTNHLTALAITHFSYGLLFNSKGGWKRSIEHLRKSIGYFEKAQYLWPSVISWVYLGYAAAVTGDPEKGLRYAEKGFEIQRKSGISMFLAGSTHFSAVIHMENGDLKNARVTIEKAIEISQENSEKANEARSWISLGRILGKEDPIQFDRAEKNFERHSDVKKNEGKGALFTGIPLSGGALSECGQERKSP